MTEKVANFVVGLFSGLAGSLMGKYLVIFIISLF